MPRDPLAAHSVGPLVAADFIRKAIGWSLRAYAETDQGAPHAVVTAERERPSPLSVREALRSL